jgi:hypothetical protein
MCHIWNICWVLKYCQKFILNGQSIMKLNYRIAILLLWVRWSLYMSYTLYVSYVSLFFLQQVWRHGPVGKLHTYTGLVFQKTLLSQHLIKLLYLLFSLLIHYYKTSNNIPFEIMSGNLSFIFDCPILCKTVQEHLVLNIKLDFCCIFISFYLWWYTNI